VVRVALISIPLIAALDLGTCLNPQERALYLAISLGIIEVRRVNFLSIITSLVVRRSGKNDSSKHIRDKIMENTVISP